MRWKNVKDYFDIGHTVQKTEDGVCIGTLYSPALLVIDATGAVTKHYEGEGSKDLARYLREMSEVPGLLRHLMWLPDEFATNVKVYTYQGGEVLEKQCEVPGWPNVTHDGVLMLDQTYSTDRNLVIEWAKRATEEDIRYCNHSIVQLKNSLRELHERMARNVTSLRSLCSLTPVTLADNLSLAWTPENA